MKIPPTRTHRQLAEWINQNGLLFKGKHVQAYIIRSWVSTDQKIGRLLRLGRGRSGTQLRLYAGDPPGHTEIYSHNTAETYRRHSEARAWVAQNLKKS